jgi:flagellar hook assembly protein FlgD
VDLSIYSVAGRRIRTLEHGIFPAGPHRSEWNGNDDGGTRAAAGVYLLRLVTESKTRVQRLVLQR